MSGYCADCGCRTYNGACTNCHEEIFIQQQNDMNAEPIIFSDEFMHKVADHERKIRKVINNV